MASSTADNIPTSEICLRCPVQGFLGVVRSDLDKGSTDSEGQKEERLQRERKRLVPLSFSTS